MSNMSYCRFYNTAQDLQDCYDNWELNENANEDEKRAKKDIVELCKNIVEIEED